jgi:hypothetical protein
LGKIKEIDLLNNKSSNVIFAAELGSPVLGDHNTGILVLCTMNQRNISK